MRAQQGIGGVVGDEGVMLHVDAAEHRHEQLVAHEAITGHRKAGALQAGDFAERIGMILIIKCSRH